ncbi:MAG: methyltransferase domain-containing protein [Bacillota bacterium]|nr:methyltransferase domain-containing protein [Bacillota bacterium]
MAGGARGVQRRLWPQCPPQALATYRAGPGGLLPPFPPPRHASAGLWLWPGFHHARVCGSVLASGSVVGIDREPRQVERARTLAAERGAANVEFRVGNIYELSFPDASFDAAFAHNVLERLSDPLRALREMRRVLRPGGVVGRRHRGLPRPTWMPVWSCVLRCVFGARVLGNGLHAYDEARCYGCGLCVTTCPERAISLVPRPRA